MKRISSYIAVVAAACLASCSKYDGRGVASSATRTIEFTVPGQTRTSILGDGGVVWNEGDAIDIHYMSRTGAAGRTKAVASLYSGGASGTVTVFRAEIPADETPGYYYASYPEGCGSFNASTGAFTLDFSGCDGTFSTANIMAAYTPADVMHLDFRNAGAIMCIEVPTDGMVKCRDKEYPIRGVSVSGQGSTFVQSATALPVIVADGTVAAFGEPSGTFSTSTAVDKLPASVFEDGHVYLPILPGEYSRGYYIRFTGEDDIPAYLSDVKPVSLERGHMRRVGGVAEKIVWDYYVSRDGKGSGRGKDDPMSLQAMSEMISLVADSLHRVYSVNGTVFHLQGGVTFDASEMKAFDFPGPAPLRVTVQGGWNSTGKTVLDGGGRMSFICSKAPHNLHFCGIEFRGGMYSSDTSGGGVLYATDGDIHFDDCDFISNTADSKTGGAFYLTKSVNIFVSRCRFVGNSCTGNSGGGVYIYNASGRFYFTNCIFYGNSTGAQYGAAVHCNNSGSASRFIAFNNCLLYDNYGTKTAADGPSNIMLSMSHCIMNSSLVSPVPDLTDGSDKKGNVFSLRCGNPSPDFGGSFILNNVIVNENSAAGSYQPYSISTVNTSYTLRSCGYNQYSTFNDNDQFMAASSDNQIGYPVLGSKAGQYTYTWNPLTCEWAWDAGKKVGDMPTLATLLGIVERDKDGVAGGRTAEFVDWLHTIVFPSGDDALSVDLYGNRRDPDAMWPGCYQKQ